MTHPYSADETGAAGDEYMPEGRHGDTYPDLPWEPKAAFTALADFYSA